jgi:hypothetical protein
MIEDQFKINGKQTFDSKTMFEDKDPLLLTKSRIDKKITSNLPFNIIYSFFTVLMVIISLVINYLSIGLL